MTPRIVGRYALGPLIAAGGMAQVYVGRLLKLARAVAIKQLRPELARERSLVAMFLDEVQLLSRVRHKNVIAPIDHIEDEGELFFVMEYVEGAALSQLWSATDAPLDAAIASRIVSDLLGGLAAAHDALDPNGQPLGIVHRDISPQNILLGTDGAARLADFGIAKAAWRAHVTQHGELRGKPGYMAPEQFGGAPVDRRADLYATGVVLGELLTSGIKLDEPPDLASLALTQKKAELLRGRLQALGSPLTALVAKALARDPEQRFADAKSMARALLDIVPPARDDEVAAWVTRAGAGELARRRRCIEELDRAVAELADSELELPASALGMGVVAQPPDRREIQGTPNSVTLADRAPPRDKRAYWLAAAVASLLVLSIVAVAFALSRTPVLQVRASKQAAPSSLPVPLASGSPKSEASNVPLSAPAPKPSRLGKPPGPVRPPPVKASTDLRSAPPPQRAASANVESAAPYSPLDDPRRR